MNTDTETTANGLGCVEHCILLVEDDEDDYILTRSMLAEIRPPKIALDWTSSYEDALERMSANTHELYLVDYRLGNRDGLQLMRDAIASGCKGPVLFLTGQGQYEVDVEAMRAGAADYLLKDQLTPSGLERAIRYALERKRVAEELKSKERLLRIVTTQLLNAQETERKRLARDLHDSVGQSLAAIKFKVEDSLESIAQDGGVRHSMEKIVAMLQYTIEETRKICQGLRPSILDDLGAVAAISWFCREFQSLYSTIRIEKSIDIDEQEVPEHLKIVIFRIMQEAFNNIAKHSQADRVQICLHRSGPHLRLVIADNGKGFVPGGEPIQHLSTGTGGSGLEGMRERAELYGGLFELQTAPGRGTAIEVRWNIG